METIESYAVIYPAFRKADGLPLYLVTRASGCPDINDIHSAYAFVVDEEVNRVVVTRDEIESVGKGADIMVLSRWYEKQEGNGKLPWKVTTTVTLAGREIYHAVVCTEQVRLPEPMLGVT